MIIIIFDLKNKINQQILDGLSLNEIAGDNLIDIKFIKNAERKRKDVESDFIKNEVIEKSFTTNIDFVSDMFDIDDKKAIVINVDKVENEKPYKLEDVFELVTNDWVHSLKIKSLEKKVNEISINQESIEEISKFVKVDSLNKDIKIDDTNYPAVLINNIFTNKINQISLSVVNDDIYISEVKKITFPEEIENIQKISILSELKGNFGSEVIKNKNISTNDNLIQALISQY